MNKELEAINAMLEEANAGPKQAEVVETNGLFYSVEEFKTDDYESLPKTVLHMATSLYKKVLNHPDYKRMIATVHATKRILDGLGGHYEIRIAVRYVPKAAQQLKEQEHAKPIQLTDARHEQGKIVGDSKRIPKRKSKPVQRASRKHA